MYVPETNANDRGQSGVLTSAEDLPTGEVIRKTQPELQNSGMSYGSSGGSSLFPTLAATLPGGSVISQNGRSPNQLFTTQWPPTPASNYDPTTNTLSYHDITQSLLATFPSQNDIEILLGMFIGLSSLSKQCNFKSRKVPPKDTRKEQTSNANLLRPEHHPVLLAGQMLHFATALQNLSPKKVIPGVSEHHHAIMQRLAKSAIKLVTANEEFLGTLEALEDIILEALFHTDSGNIRRAWVSMRRAVSAGHLLGLHRPGHYRFKAIEKQNDLDPEVMWTRIIYMERVLSLLLGLPTSTGGPSSEIQDEPQHSTRSCSLPTLVTHITTKIIDRNQMKILHHALEKTQQIDQELIKLTQLLPSTFWRPMALAGLNIDSNEAFKETRRASDQMFYYTVVNQLHLPYMLSQSHVSQRVHSRIACVNASREILTREIAICTFDPNTPNCRIGDFMALIAGLTLMLAHVVTHEKKDVSLVHQRLSDRAIVETALECMKSMSELHEDALVVKCAVLLKDLLAIEADIAQGQPAWINGNLQNNHEVLTIKVPYIGAIRITRDGITSIAVLEVERDQGSNETVTLGGIGSIHVKGSTQADLHPGYGVPEVVDQHGQVTRSISTKASQTEEHPTQFTQSASEDFPFPPDQMFPHPAASMEDWVFQGLDTAFFEVLMRENGDGANEWNFGLDS
ncbi:Transcription factor protein [Rutstroemia sp. NJR-2017a BVV2]|nr:Transcription factor protein [Rutstroemia sp. NJR-2017a BVV2]